MPCHVVMAKALVHCARGPERCARCREMTGITRWQLLDVDPPEQDRSARPTIALRLNGKILWRVYDVVRTFDDEAQARAYAALHELPFIDESNDAGTNS